MSTPSVAQSKPKPEAPGRPILPKKWDGKAVFDVAEVAEIFEMNTWVIYDLIRRKESRENRPLGQGAAARHRGNADRVNSSP